MPKEGTGRRRQPHDALVRFTFSQRPHAVGLLKSTLPDALVRAVDWRSLRIEKDTFVDRALRRLHSDLVYSARLKDERCLFYTLFEHQSSVDPLMVFRMSQYMGRLWEHLLRQEPTRTTLPPVVPLLLHHGPTAWTAPRAFPEIIDGSGPERASIEHHIPRFEMKVIDLGDAQAASMAEKHITALGRLTKWCLAVAGDDQRLAREAARMGKVIDEALAAPDGHAALDAVLQYLVATHARMQPEQVRDLVTNASNKQTKETIVDLWEYVRRKGKKEGFVEGKHEGFVEGKHEGLVEGKHEGLVEGERTGLVKALLRALPARFGQLPASARKRIEAADEPQLAAWVDAMMTALSLTALLDTPPHAHATNTPSANHLRKPSTTTSARRTAKSPNRSPATSGNRSPATSANRSPATSGNRSRATSGNRSRAKAPSRAAGPS